MRSRAAQQYMLRMSGEVHAWLAGLHGSDPVAAGLVGQALAALVTEGAGLGEPPAVSTADAWALAEARRSRVLEAPEAAAHGYDGTPSLLAD